MPLLISNLEGCGRKHWQTADRKLAAQTVEALVHLIAKVTPGAKKGSTAPYDWASLVLLEAGDEQPRTLANAFIKPVKTSPFDTTAAKALTDHVAAIDRMYGNESRRWFATRLDGTAVPDAELAPLPTIATAISAAIRGDG